MAVAIVVHSLENVDRSALIRGSAVGVPKSVVLKRVDCTAVALVQLEKWQLMRCPQWSLVVAWPLSGAELV